MTESKLNNIIVDTYQLLFEASTPKGDFRKLVEDAEVDEEGIKVIPFMDYEIDYDEMDEILENQESKYNIPKNKKSGFRNAIYLGCSPKYKKI